MDGAKAIQVAVARADLIVCSILRLLAIIIPLTVIFLIVLLVVWANRPDPYLIDYDSPDVDITSEGPAEDYTDAWRDWR